MKKAKTWLIILSVIAVAALVWGGITTVRWQDIKAEKNELESQLLATTALWWNAKEQLAMATIIGWAYVDRGEIEALDGSDWPLAGLKIQLYQVSSQGNTMVQETVVDDYGQYSFTIEQPGMYYYVLPVYAITGYPAWSCIIHLRSPGNILVEEGGLYLGPTFLARENGWPKG